MLEDEPRTEAYLSAFPADFLLTEEILDSLRKSAVRKENSANSEMSFMNCLIHSIVLKNMF